jgi:FKBP-type peptidyl-prolyl cis-trans isomerase SlyD
MKVEKDRVVRFHYTVSEAGGGELETSREREPLAFLAGRGGIIPGLEGAFEGKQAGDRFEATVEPDQAYGPRREGATQRIPKKHFGKEKLVPGATVVLRTNQGPRMVVVQKVGMSVVDVDLNHPMAGKTLKFDIEVVDVREANAEEIAHGHAHGDGGHKHD